VQRFGCIKYIYNPLGQLCSNGKWRVSQPKDNIDVDRNHCWDQLAKHPVTCNTMGRSVALVVTASCLIGESLAFAPIVSTHTAVLGNRRSSTARSVLAEPLVETSLPLLDADRFRDVALSGLNGLALHDKAWPTKVNAPATHYPICNPGLAMCKTSS
jgi:hypothetical protein